MHLLARLCSSHHGSSYLCCFCVDEDNVLILPTFSHFVCISQSSTRKRWVFHFEVWYYSMIEEILMKDYLQRCEQG